MRLQYACVLHTNTQKHSFFSLTPQCSDLAKIVLISWIWPSFWSTLGNGDSEGIVVNWFLVEGWVGWKFRSNSFTAPHGFNQHLILTRCCCFLANGQQQFGMVHIRSFVSPPTVIYLTPPVRITSVALSFLYFFLLPLFSFPSGWLACFSQISLFPLANVSNLAGHTDCSHIYCSIYFRYKLDVIVVVWVAKTIATNKKLAGKKLKERERRKESMINQWKVRKGATFAKKFINCHWLL